MITNAMAPNSTPATSLQATFAQLVAQLTQLMLGIDGHSEPIIDSGRTYGLFGGCRMWDGSEGFPHLTDPVSAACVAYGNTLQAAEESLADTKAVTTKKPSQAAIEAAKSAAKDAAAKQPK